MSGIEWEVGELGPARPRRGSLAGATAEYGKQRLKRWGLLGIACFLWTACGPSLEDSVEKLGGSPEQREEGRQELLLAKDRAVEPLLEALEDEDYAAARPDLVEVLVGLMTRVEDERIKPVLLRHLQADPDPRVRARIARRLGMYQPGKHVEALLEALADGDGAVCYEALLALGKVENDLTEAQQERLREHARRLAADAHRGARLEAQIRVESIINRWIEEARQLALQARLAEAESLFARAIEYSPTSKRGNYRLARFYFDNGRREEGLQRLREHGMLLDIPLLSRPPDLDGRLDETVWQEAARADSFYLHSGEHFAAVPSEVRTTIYLGYTREALYVGFRGHDDHPDSLVAEIRNRDGELWHDDIVELFVNPLFDHRDYAHVGINSLGVIADAWWSGRFDSRSVEWNARGKAKVHVGRDFWSLEYRLDFGQKELPAPQSGSLWGFNFVRVHRGAEYSQWVRTYSGGHSPDDFGLLVFL